MKIHPTVLIGLGSTGKHVLTNVQRYLYEVLNADTLEVFQFIVLETATEADYEGPGLTSQVRPVDIKVRDIGKVWYGMKAVLGSAFRWCPEDLRIQGPGAGNKRAGGRLMMLANMDTVGAILQKAISDVRTAAQSVQTVEEVNRLLSSRGLAPVPDPFATDSVFFVVGTLAGGTCSGACIDLAYLIRKLQPSARREALFVFPDDTAIDTYKANSWAALADLKYFAEHPDGYRAEWLSTAQTKVTYSTADSPAPPYDHVYLVSQRDQMGDLQLRYELSPRSPLLMMVGMFLTADLLGLSELRGERLADLNQRVGSNRVHNMLLTNSLRGVSYPKYELSEAAACEIIAQRICRGWLDSQTFVLRGSPHTLQEEETNRRGRESWNAQASGVWSGLRGNVDIPALAKQIQSGQIADVATAILQLFADPGAGTIYSQVEQNVAGRFRLLQDGIRQDWIAVMQETQNLLYADWFLNGVRSEITRTLAYWRGLGIPHGTNDVPAWRALAKDMTGDILARRWMWSALALAARRRVLEDELNSLVTRLEMFLMYGALERLATWIAQDLQATSDRVRTVLREVQTLAQSRLAQVVADLDDRSGPLLKISRSPDRRFSQEIQELAPLDPQIAGTEYVRYEQTGPSGFLPFGPQLRPDEKERVFHDLRRRIQPMLIQRLQAEGPIDIVQEIQRQGVAGTAAQRGMVTQELSITVRQPLMVGKENVPSFVLAKSDQVATAVIDTLRRVNKAFPDLAPKALPLFDHLALFYQDGGKVDTDILKHAGDMREAYERVQAEDAAVVDPLRLLKTAAGPTTSATV
jgi:hypothetical protein